jgi:hypothetical protein
METLYSKDTSDLSSFDYILLFGFCFLFHYLIACSFEFWSSPTFEIENEFLSTSITINYVSIILDRRLRPSCGETVNGFDDKSVTCPHAQTDVVSPGI